MTNLLKRYSVLILFLFIGVLPASLNYSGFCFAKGKWLSNDERIRLSIEYINDLSKLPIKTQAHGTQYYKQIKYKNVDEFLERNPNCCQVNSGGAYDLPPPEFMDRITGFNSAKILEINFIARYLDENGQEQSQIIKSQGLQTNCGRSK